MSGKLLYAAIFANEANAARSARRSLQIVSEGRIAVVMGLPLRGAMELTARAIAHDQVMQNLLERCSAVMPFRLDTRAPIAPDLSRLLREHGSAIESNLLRFKGRVEMGIRMKSQSGTPFSGRLDCSRLHKLAGSMQHRREKIVVLESGALFEGTYLIKREAMDDFWAAVLEIRKALPGFAVIGTGPWAPYSFCDLELPEPGSGPMRRSA